MGWAATAVLAIQWPTVVSGLATAAVAAARGEIEAAVSTKPAEEKQSHA
jgi:hypothetical protein